MSKKQHGFLKNKQVELLQLLKSRSLWKTTRHFRKCHFLLTKDLLASVFKNSKQQKTPWVTPNYSMLQRTLLGLECPSIALWNRLRDKPGTIFLSCSASLIYNAGSIGTILVCQKVLFVKLTLYVHTQDSIACTKFLF